MQAATMENGEEPKKKRERHNCCVPQCSVVKSPENHLHYFPKDTCRRKQWVVAIKTGKYVSDSMQVCSKHFKPDDYIISTGAGHRRCLKPTAVPSLYLPERSHDKVLTSPLKRKSMARAERVKKRLLCTSTAVENEDSVMSGEVGGGSANSSAKQHDKSSKSNPWLDVGQLDSADEVVLQHAGVQVDLLSDDSGIIKNILSSDKKLYTATGVHSVELLASMVTCFDKIAVESPRQKFSMETRDRIIMTMLKIKLGINFSSVAVLFDITVQTCCNYFYDTVLILAKVMNCMIFWPEKEDVLKNMPKCFSRYKCTRVVLDCFEVPMEKYKCVKCRVRSYSQYKKTNTAKLQMTVTPSGLICYTSAAFGGRASDKVITFESGIYQKCDPYDGIMVDKGYNIDDECQEFMLKVIRPPFLRQKKQFSRAEAVECAKIARARVHVERVIQRVRDYHILKNRMSAAISPYVNELYVIIAALCELGESGFINGQVLKGFFFA